ncbi:N-acetylmuramoyl-L-alanine amidase [Albirhodobacter sp. R86504]|uniref:N-acetylmuramoyl-L-alanine amidase n=1 Tax=Albirhodobacter sp. R86504 TaxID=3093848 RepID=UPI00366A6E12
MFGVCWAQVMRGVIAPALIGAIVAAGGMTPVMAQGKELSALARIIPERSSIISRGSTLSFEIGLTQPIPFRSFLLDNPPRLIVDFREVDFSAMDPKALMGAPGLKDLRWGPFREGWSRLVAELEGPMAVTSARARTVGDPAVQLRLVPVDQAAFDAREGAPQSALWDLPQPANVAPSAPRQRGDGPLMVVLDPGHGGIDPGAEAGGQRESVLMMTFARELKDRMTRAGMKVLMTREEDVFVPLETRITLARAAGADLFLSLHADALAEGNAQGATVYTFDSEDADDAAELLSQRHDRGDLLAGVDLHDHDDEVAGVLMDLARAETAPRASRLSVSLVAAIQAADIKMHRHPAQTGAFSVLKSPDFPAALIELGFLSSEGDRERLIDADWRGTMADAITLGVEAWARGDAVEADLLRQ